MLRSLLLPVGLLAIGSHGRCLSCTPDSCLQVVKTTGIAGDCSSYLVSTIVPNTVTFTVTAFSTETTEVVDVETSTTSVFSTEGTSTTVTKPSTTTTTAVVSDFSTVTDVSTSTEVAFVTVTLTATESSTTTTTVTALVQRGLTSTTLPTGDSLPPYAAAVCTDAFAFYSACRCGHGVESTTVTGSTPTVTATVTSTVLETLTSGAVSSVAVTQVTTSVSTITVTEVETEIVTSTTQVVGTVLTTKITSETSTETASARTTEVQTATAVTTKIATPTCDTFYLLASGGTLGGVTRNNWYVSYSAAYNGIIAKSITTQSQASKFRLEASGLLRDTNTGDALSVAPGSLNSGFPSQLYEFTDTATASQSLGNPTCSITSLSGSDLACTYGTASTFSAPQTNFAIYLGPSGVNGYTSITLTTLAAC